MKDFTVLTTLLQIKEPWTLVDVRCDATNKRCDTWIGLEQRRGWFGLAIGKTPPQQATLSWRHTNLGEWNWFVHVMAPAGANLARLPWCGEIGLPFTRALEQQLSTLFTHLPHLETVGSLLRLDMIDIAHAYNKGRLQGQGAALPLAAAAPDARRTNEDDADIPPANAPLWDALLEGRHSFQVRATGLQLFLFNLRMQYRRADTPAARLQHAQECRRYFVRNRRQLAFELGQLTASNTHPATTPRSREAQT